MATALTPAERARATLLEHLSLRQRVEFERTGTFYVQGGNGRRYRLGRTWCVVEQEHQMRGGPFGWFKYTDRYVNGIWCSDTDFRKDDHVLAQKLLLEADERAFLQIACCSRA